MKTYDNSQLLGGDVAPETLGQPPLVLDPDDRLRIEVLEKLTERLLTLTRQPRRSAFRGTATTRAQPTSPTAT